MKLNIKFGRQTKYGTNAVLMAVIVLAILVLVNAISVKHKLRFDLTENKRFSLSDETRKVLDSLDEDVDIIAFYQEGNRNKRRVQDLLEQYAYRSPKVKYEFVDPDRFPGRAKAFEIEAYGTTVVQCGKNVEKITDADEEKLTNAILKVTRKEKKVIYFLTGHGEPALDDFEKRGFSSVKKAIEGKGYVVKKLLLAQSKGVPEDASILVVAGPKKELLKEEIESIDSYIKRGGKVLFMLDPFEAPGMKKFLEKYGIALGDDVIVDRLSRVFGGDYLIPVIMDYSSHPITKGFNVMSFFPLARSVDVVKKPPENVEAQVLAKTGKAAWAEVDLEEVKKGRAQFNEGKDKKGPVSVAVVANIKVKIKKKAGEEEAEEEEVETKKARIVVFGDSDFVTNANMGISGNGDLFLNTVSWLAEEENLISIRAKSTESQPIMLTARQGKVLFWIPVVLMPLAFLVTGVTVVVRRRLRG